MTLDKKTGRLANTPWRASPFFNARPETAISLVVLHHISLPPGRFGSQDVDDLFRGTLKPKGDPFLESLVGLEVSSHFFIQRTGQILQYVSTLDRAWHAGVSTFEGRSNCNDFSIGIELEGTGEIPFTDAQYASLQDLLTAIIDAHPIEAITGHEHIAPGRKQDPGPSFDWSRLAAFSSRARIVTKPQGECD